MDSDSTSQMSNEKEDQPQPLYKSTASGDTAVGSTAPDVDHEDPQALTRVSTGRSQISTPQEQALLTRILTGNLSRRRSSRVPAMGGGRPFPPPLPNRDDYRVDYDGPNDPEFPHNWPFRKKAIICVALGYSTAVVAWGSSIFASAVPFVSNEFHVGEVVAILGVSLYVMGFASGPVLWAPFSELYGRKLPILISMLGFTLFSFAVATAKDLQTILICRFFGGFFGAAPLAVVAAAFADLFNNEQRGLALTAFSGAVFCGPILAPVIGGFISFSYLGWRWTMYITGIMGALGLVLDLYVYEESYHPIILAHKAQAIRRSTGNWGIFAPHEAVELNLRELATKNLARPMLMLFTEPILFLVTIYTAFVYGILYLLLEAYPIIFAEGYGMKGGVAELPYLGLILGMLSAAATVAFVFDKRYQRAVRANGGKPVPEERLTGMIAGAIMFPIGIFLLTWSGNYPDKVHWIVPTISGLFTGFGLLAIFMCAINYIVDCYLLFAASALAGNTFLRSAFGAAFPLFASQMFHNMGTNWAGTLLGCVAVVMIPVPVLFYVYGRRLRRSSKFAFDLSAPPPAPAAANDA